LLGALWWKYIGLSMRIVNSVLIIGGDLTPENYLLITRIIPHVNKIYLTGKLGLKFFSI
jgi:hypothetical protein